MKLSSSQKPATDSALFASVRGSRDLSLVAFGTALLAAVALQTGAFVPRITSPDARREAAVVETAKPDPVPAAMAASEPVPCAPPRG